MKVQIKHFAERVFKDGMKGLEAQIKLNMEEIGYEFKDICELQYKGYS